MRVRSYVLLAISLVSGSDLWADVLYSVTDLSTLIASDASANDINNAGQIVGYTGPPTASQAFIYSSGQITCLGTFGGTYSSANGINDAGQVVGKCRDVVGRLSCLSLP